MRSSNAFVYSQIGCPMLISRTSPELQSSMCFATFRIKISARCRLVCGWGEACIVSSCLPKRARFAGSNGGKSYIYSI